MKNEISVADLDLNKKGSKTLENQLNLMTNNENEGLNLYINDQST